MYRISVEQHFDAAHFLRGYQGKCEALHGHRFRVVAKITASGVNEVGLAYDFTVLKQQLGEILSRFDHTYLDDLPPFALGRTVWDNWLNDLPPFDKINPSSENIAATIYNELKLKVAGAPISLSCVEVWESPQSGVAYSPD